MPRDDAELVRRAQQDDERAFAELVRRYQSRLRYSLRQMTGCDEALADALAQETFVKAHRHLRGFRGEARFFSWLYKIAWRCCADHYRRRLPERVLDESVDITSLPASHGAADLQLDFARALLQFEPQQRMALHLHLQREFTHAEIAAILDCPLGTVKSHIKRGRDRLQQSLREWLT